MSDNIKTLVKRLMTADLKAIAQAANLIEQQAALMDLDKTERIQLHDRIDILDKRIAELEKNAARYRWIRSATGPQMRDAGCLRSDNVPISGDELDAAIDAAMQSKEPQ